MPGKSSSNTQDPVARRDLEQSVLRKLRVIFSSAKKHFRIVEEKCGISGAQLWALIEVRDHPGIRVSVLAQLMAIHRSTASNLLDKLQGRGLIERVRTDADQRVVCLHLTGRGQHVVATAPRPARGVVPDALGRLPREDLAGLNVHLDELLGRLRVRDRGADIKPLSDL